MPISILDNAYKPTSEELGESIEGDFAQVWHEITHFIEDTFKAKSQIDYSTCSGKPGWNLKYKKGSRALCTIYPEKDFFIVLVVLGAKERELFDVMREEYCDYIKQLYDNAKLFNNTKWLMISTLDQVVISNIKRLLKLKAKNFNLKSN